MILADTCIWIDHLRHGEPELGRLLEDDSILMHPWIRGELALGSIQDHSDFIRYLGYLPGLKPAADDAIMELIDKAELSAKGIGWVDAGLLASCIAYPCRLWTRDARLAAIARELGLAPIARNG